MSPLKKIIVTTALSGPLAAAIFVVSAGYLFISIISSMFGGSFLNSPSEDIAAMIVALMCALASTLICPFSAIYVRKSVIEITSSQFKRLLIYCLISSFQIIILFVGYVTLATFTNVSAERNRQKAIEDSKAHQTILDELKSANVEVIADNARIVGDDGNLVVADVTFQIRNVPFVVPYYDLSLLPTPNDNQLSYKLHSFPDKLNKPSDGPDQRRSIKAKNESGRWVFYKSFTDELISDDSNKISLQIEIEHLRPSMLQVSTTITPQLTVWGEEKGRWNNSVFWSKPIPITIRRF